MDKKPKIAVAMSGGVDSSVAAALLVEQGYEVLGLHLHLWVEPTAGIKNIKVENRCCSTEQLDGARVTAQILGIPFYVLNFEKPFKEAVVDYFLKEYGNLKTPNPCVVCNKFIRFGKLLDYALKLGCDYLATGHYAKVEHTDKGYKLLAGADKKKDQAYFLYALTQQQLAHILFPVGHLHKPQVRKIAEEKNLPVAQKPESQEICFMVSDDYRDFLCRYIPDKIKPGKVVDMQGKFVGEHRGLPLYTIGQRKGFTTNINVPLYVVGFDEAKNTLIVGRGKESEVKKFQINNVNWVLDKKPKLPFDCKVRLRHQGELLSARVKGLGSRIVVELKESERGVTPGQSAVFYQGNEVIGGGVIEK